MTERIPLTDELRQMGFQEPNTGIVEEPWEYWQIRREDAQRLVGMEQRSDDPDEEPAA